MKVTENPSLSTLNTFGVKAQAGLLIAVESEEDVLAMPAFDPGRDIVLGGGSNVLFRTNVPGVVFLNRIAGRGIVQELDDHVLVEIGAGENWHELVTWAVQEGLSGLENLALIPGLSGAAPIQNIGAYGVEVAQVLESVTAWDWKNACWVTLKNEQCHFSYRDSIFKSMEPDRYFITSIRLKLKRQFIACLDYSGLEDELQSAGIAKPGSADVYHAVIRLRRRKLPDPVIAGNAGSFFKNPVVSRDDFENLHAQHPALPFWEIKADQLKLSAAWMIQSCGLKAYCMGSACVSDLHALVITNQGSASGEDIWQLALHIQNVVRNRFGISLEPEPRIYTNTNAL